MRPLDLLALPEKAVPQQNATWSCLEWWCQKERMPPRVRPPNEPKPIQGESWHSSCNLPVVNWGKAYEHQGHHMVTSWAVCARFDAQMGWNFWDGRWEGSGPVRDDSSCGTQNYIWLEKQTFHIGIWPALLMNFWFVAIPNVTTGLLSVPLCSASPPTRPIRVTLLIPETGVFGPPQSQNWSVPLKMVGQTKHLKRNESSNSSEGTVITQV